VREALGSGSAAAVPMNSHFGNSVYVSLSEVNPFIENVGFSNQTIKMGMGNY